MNLKTKIILKLLPGIDLFELKIVVDEIKKINDKNKIYVASINKFKK